MREVLFRGKNYDGEWIEGYYVHQGKSHEIYYKDYQEFPSRFVTPETVGQFTGLTDKNGKKIFEGDIIQYKEFILQVEYAERYASFFFHNKGSVIGECNCRYTKEYAKIIGNIHDNPELLGGDDKWQTTRSSLPL